MFGINSAYSRVDYWKQTNPVYSRAQTTPTEEIKTPVRPVSNVLPVSRDLPIPEESTLPKVGADAVEGYKKGADPVEMQVRGRIQYLSEDDLANEIEKAKSPHEIMEENECQTCEKRKYQDVSDDAGVSFQTPTELSPERAASAVRGHEMEHVVREQAKADQEGREVVSQTVTYQSAICPECGKAYISGGTTTTTTRAEQEPVEQAQASTPFEFFA